MSEPTVPVPTVPAPTAEEIVAVPLPGAADLEKEIKQAAQPFGKLTMWLGVLAVVALAFAGGAWTHSALAGGSKSAATPARTAATGTPGTPGQAGQGRQGGGGGQRGTSGTVDRVDGTTVYVKTVQGNEVAVSTSDSTTVEVAQPGRLSDLKAGADVVVQGATGSDGTVTARSITQQPARGG